MKLKASAMVKSINQSVTSITAQIKDLQTTADHLHATLVAAAAPPGSRPKTLPILLSFLFFLAALMVLYYFFLDIEPPAVIPI